MYNIIHFLFIYCKSYIYTQKKKKKNLTLFVQCKSMNIIIPFSWVSVSSTGKVSDGCIRDLKFNLRLYQKLIGVLV